jgi:hypothetical protein
MARKNNFLLGQGERLTLPVQVPSGGGEKEPPYSLSSAHLRISTKLKDAIAVFDALPDAAAPGNMAVATITLHPRYSSKSDFPEDLLEANGLHMLGSKSVLIAPEEWGITKHPEKEYTEALFVSATRDVFRSWQARLESGHALARGADQLIKVEDFSAYLPIDKVKGIKRDDARHGLLEVVLHNAGDQRTIETFTNFVESLGGKPLRSFRRDVRGLTFLPVELEFRSVFELASFAFVRAARPMPKLRPLKTSLTRGQTNATPKLPETGPIDPGVRAVIFDGGLPLDAASKLAPWVQYIEPIGIGAPVPDDQDHGLAVTSAFLFGGLRENGSGAEQDRPVCSVDHVRVLDCSTGTNGDLMGLEALRRIERHLQANPTYEFINISLGPQMPAEDDDITEWTAVLDDIFSTGRAVVSVAAGNDGDQIENRIQPPADGVNVLSVGAASSLDTTWNRAIWSCVGPGRSPGFVKPDGLVFGGTQAQPLLVLGSDLGATGTFGTSFSAPLALRACAALKVQTGTNLSPLALRAVMIHRADPGNHDRAEVGWGRFETDPDLLLTCEDYEALVIYQDVLPIGEHLRIPVPLPSTPLTGQVTLAATLLIAPDVDADRPGAYTRGGVEVSFRPHDQRYATNEDGSTSTHPKTETFFSAKNLYGAEAAMRESHFKWEPCCHHFVRKNPSSLRGSCFDVYYHHRISGVASILPRPMPYAFVVSLRAPKTKDLYDRVRQTFANTLIALRPRTQVQVRSR